MMLSQAKVAKEFGIHHEMNRRVLVCPILVFFAAVIVSPVHADLTANLQGYWHFDGDGTDSSGNGRDLSLFGGPGYSTGTVGQALDLTGKNQSTYAARPSDDAVFDFGGGDFTIQAWVNYDSTTTEQVLIEKWVGAGGPGWTLTKLANDSFRFHLDGSYFTDSAPIAITEDAWHHIVAVRQGTDFSLFFDNTAIINTSVGSNAASDVSTPLLIGRRHQADGRDFSMNGLLDEYAIWDRALTSNEIELLYNNGDGTDIAAIPAPGAAVLALIGLPLVRRMRRR